jgi:hypothetical protein
VCASGRIQTLLCSCRRKPKPLLTGQEAVPLGVGAFGCAPIIIGAFEGLGEGEVENGTACVCSCENILLTGS